jgi:hypothetical protein
MGLQPINEKFLGSLVRLKEDGGKENERVARILVELAAHADLAIYLNALKVRMMITTREDHQATDLPVFPTVSQADVAVFAGFSEIHRERDVQMFDGMISDRAVQPSRVTILILPKRNPPEFPTTMSLFGDRRFDLWPRRQKRSS